MDIFLCNFTTVTVKFVYISMFFPTNTVVEKEHIFYVESMPLWNLDIFLLFHYFCFESWIFFLYISLLWMSNMNTCIFLLFHYCWCEIWIFLLCFSADALEKNQMLEFERNKERFVFLKVSCCLKNHTFFLFCIPKH